MTIHHLRKYPAAPLRPARETKITLVLYPVDVVREATTALQDTYANGEFNNNNLDLHKMCKKGVHGRKRCEIFSLPLNNKFN
jgi:hypothetical protein